MQAVDMIESPLQPIHDQAGAKFAEFGGWKMPLEYAGGGVLAEHAAVREGVGIFDVSHLGKMRITGPEAAAFVNRCLTNDLDKIGAGQAQYTLICAEDGGVIDDLIVYRMSDEEIFAIPNAANNATVVETMAKAAPGGITVANEHRDYAVIAVQGPRSAEVLSAAGLPVDHDYMSFARAELDGVALTVCRTGYTGEKGYELVAPAADAVGVWERIVDAGRPHGIRPAGLGARDTLRTEMGYPLHGQDISPDISPVQGRVGWAVGWKKPEFFGHEALRAEKAAGAKRTLRGLRATGRGIPRAHMEVQDADGRRIGEVTSGTFSPTLKTGIALALIDTGLEGTAEGDTVRVAIRNRTEEFELVKPPFVQTDTR